jgi:hypothetical protein
MFYVFQVFHRYVVIVSYGCYKSRSRCCICCNGLYVCCKGLFLMFHLCFRIYVASVFYLDVTYVSQVCCKCFIWILHMFCNGFQTFSGFFLVFQTYVASVASRCFKSKSGVVSPSSLFLLPRLGVFSSSKRRLGILRTPILFPMLVMFGAARGIYVGSGWGGRRQSSRGMCMSKAEGRRREAGWGSGV